MSEATLNDDPSSIKVGDLVTTEFDPDARDVVRRVTHAAKVSQWQYGSGYCIAADGGVKCDSCGRSEASPTPLIDGAWFLPVDAMTHPAKESP